MRLTAWRALIWCGAAALALVAAVIAIVHLPALQRAAWERAAEAVGRATGWQIEAAEFRARLWPATIEVRGLRAGAPDPGPISADRVAIRFRWSGLLSSPRRIEAIEIDGLAVDLRGLELPRSEPDPDRPPADPWQSIEIGSLEVRGARFGAAAADVELELDGLELSGGLADGTARLAARIAAIAAVRQDRRLVVGPLEVEASASEQGVDVERLELDGEVASGEITLSAGFADRRLAAGGRVEIELAPALEWFEPDLAALLRPSGRLVLSGSGEASAGSLPTVAVEHVGGPLRAAGYDITRLRLDSTSTGLRVDAGGGDWGEVAVDLARDQAVVRARFADAAIGPAVALAAAPLPSWLPGPLTVSGSVDATVPLPVAVERVAAAADLRVAFPEGRLELEGDGEGTVWRARRFFLAVPGAELSGEGRMKAGGGLSGTVLATVSEPAVLAAYLARWLPPAADVGVGGGPADLALELSGSLASPRVDAVLGWERPAASTIELEQIDGFARGDLDELEWGIVAVPVDGASLELAGTAKPRRLEAAGTWRVSLPDLAAMVALADPALADRLGGWVDGEGSFGWAGDGEWSVDGVVEASGLRVDGYRVDSVVAELAASPALAELRRIELWVLGGSLRGAGTVALTGAERAIEGRLEWSGLDPSTLPLEVPEAARGSLDGWLQLAGSVERPEGDLELRWVAGGASPVDAGSLRARLSGGEVQLASERLSTTAGPIAVTGRVPLGDVPRPAWLWPDAPRGPAELTVSGHQLELTAAAGALGGEPLPVQVDSDLALQLSWDLLDPARRFGQLALDGVSVRHAAGVISAPDGVRIGLEGGLLRLDRTRLVGPRGVVELAGEVDMVARQLRLELAGELSPEIAQLVPYPVRIEEPISIRASVEGPLAAPEGTIIVDHRGGSIVWRDPPVEVADLRVEAELGGGRLSVRDGSAGINRGRALFGGGWDPASGQGIVMELDGVTFFAAGTLTQWSGVLAVEPDPKGTARVTGDLVLAGGVWEQRADLAGAFLSGPDLMAAADDPLQGIALDLTVRSQTGVLVNNNLGRFDVRWDRLRIGGTAAAPTLVGDIQIEPGGVVRLPGKTVELQRGTIRFTGDPQVDPVVELVPVEDLAVFGDAGSSESSLDVYSLAAEGLYGELGRALGFENETLQPAEIAIETETDTSSQMLLGQRLSSNLAFFFAANPTDVRDRTTTLQLWNLDFDPGLAAQVYQSVLDESSGVSLIQRFRWGGSAEPAGLASFISGSRDSDDDERPVIHKLRLDGDWPVAKRRLRRATGLSKGQPYDPFLAFVAEVHLEQELGIAGFPEARVRSRTEGSTRSPRLVFTCETGPRYEIEFVGDDPPKAVRREVLALYMPPPLEETALVNMKLALRRHYQATGHPFAAVRADRQEDRLELLIEPGEPLSYQGPVVEGLDERSASRVREMFGSPLELAAAVEQPERAGHMVSNQLAAIGFPDARVVELTVGDPHDGVSEVRLVVDAGELVRIAEVAVAGSDPLGETERTGAALAVGSPLDRRAIDNEVAAIRRAYQEAGYDQILVRAELERLADGGGRVEIHIEPGVQRRLEGVRFTGTRHVDPRYLRTGLDLDEGELLDVFEVDESAIKIANFAPVERVQVSTVPSGSGGSVVEFDVYEKPRWTVELGAGWDSERGFEGRTGLRDDNLFGRGISANLRLRWSDIEQVALLYGSLPPLPGRDISFGGNIGYSERSGEDPYDLGVYRYQETETLAAIDLLYEVSPATTLKPYFRYTYTEREYEDPDIFYSPLTTTTLGGAVFHDHFDNPFDPRKGYSFVTDLGWSTSYLGSDVDTLQAAASGSLALEPRRGWTWVQTLRLGVAEPLRGTELDESVKFKAGGQGSIRGFDFESVGPAIESGEGYMIPLGGGAMLILNEELRTPLWKSLRGAVFVDTGQIWQSWSVADWRLSTSVGLGLRWSTPVGLVWADAAWPVSNVGISSRDPKFYFGIGRPF
jgi:outer membrane protein assembly factor BamA